MILIEHGEASFLLKFHILFNLALRWHDLEETQKRFAHVLQFDHLGIVYATDIFFISNRLAALLANIPLAALFLIITLFLLFLLIVIFLKQLLHLLDLVNGFDWLDFFSIFVENLRYRALLELLFFN